jgi:hypothetical protein
MINSDLLLQQFVHIVQVRNDRYINKHGHGSERRRGEEEERRRGGEEERRRGGEEERRREGGKEGRRGRRKGEKERESEE